MPLIRRFVITLVILTVTRVAGMAQEHNHSEMSPSHSSAQKESGLPAAEDQARSVLESSPRHGEFVSISVPGGDTIKTWVVYPERRGKAGVVILIHEIFGLSDWIRAVADQFAAEGFIALAPDLISGMGPGGGGTESLPSRDDVVKTIQKLTPEETTKRLDGVYAYALKIPSGNGRIGTTGFCWGGTTSFAYATSRPDLKAAVVYYGTSPDSARLAVIKAPVLGLYGGDDARVDATVEPAAKEMKRLGRMYEYEMFAGAGHGFLRQQSGRDGANMKATKEAWPRTIKFLKARLE